MIVFERRRSTALSNDEAGKIKFVQFNQCVKIECGFDRVSSRRELVLTNIEDNYHEKENGEGLNGAVV